MSTGTIGPSSIPAAKRTILVRRVFSFPAMLAALLAVLALLTVRSRFNDPDMWWHLKTGEVIWTTHVIPTTDLFSYTTGHHAWTPHEWLSQVFLFGTYHVGGYTALMLWLWLMFSVLLIVGYGLCATYSGNAKVALLGALIIWLFSTIGLAIRPQMVGYTLLALELLILHLGRTRSSRWFYLLPPLFALWINCHGSFFLGLIIAAALLFSAFFHFEVGSLVAVRWERRTRSVLAWMVPISALALLLNPTGIKQVMYPMQTMASLPLSMSAVSEWQPLVLSTTRGIALMAVAGCIGMLAVTRRAELLWHELLWLALGTWLAIGHQRMMFVFGILAAPILCRMLSNSWESYEFARDRVLPNAVMMVLCVMAAVLGFPGRANLEGQVTSANPVKALAFMRSHHLTGHLVNDYVYGGYLIWAAPDYPVFVDGRGDVFEWTGVLADFGSWAMLQSDPQDLLKKYRIDICLLSKDAPMAHVLPLLPGWQAVYSDELAVVFTRTVPLLPTAR